MRTQTHTRISRRTTIRTVKYGLLAALILLASSPPVGEWLVVNQRPMRVNAIIVLGGGPINRLEKGVQLFHEGYASNLVLSGGSPDLSQATQAQIMGWQAENEFHVPARDITLDNHSFTTFQNALDTRAILLRKKWTSAIVVSSDYHMRRVQFLFSHIFQSTPIHLIYVAASDPWFDPSRWWANPHSALTTVSEYAKFLFNLLQVSILPVSHTSTS